MNTNCYLTHALRYTVGRGVILAVEHVNLFVSTSSHLFFQHSPRSLTLHFSFLNIDKHSQWMNTLLEYAQDATHIDAEEDDGGNHKTDYTGYVLALNGHKKYLCLFKPVYTGEDLESKSSEDEGGPSGGRSRSSSRDDHPPRRSNRPRSISTLQIHHKLDRLGLWMERLMEGTLPRYYIPAWPGLDKITPSK